MQSTDSYGYYLYRLSIQFICTHVYEYNYNMRVTFIGLKLASFDTFVNLNRSSSYESVCVSQYFMTSVHGRKKKLATTSIVSQTIYAVCVGWIVFWSMSITLNFNNSMSSLSIRAFRSPRAGPVRTLQVDLVLRRAEIIQLLCMYNMYVHAV